MAGRRFDAFRSLQGILKSKLEGRRERSGSDPRRRRKERHMASIKIISQKLAAWRRYREAVRELSQMSDHELCDIGLHRRDIEFVARKNAA
jgi:uncharacterized protein YjiS (DUF1127 family)